MSEQKLLDHNKVTAESSKKFLKMSLFLLSLIVHGVALVIIYTKLMPVITWYLTKIPVRGVDTFLSATYVDYILKWGEYLRPEAWKYIWFGGYPFALDYPSLYFLAMIPLVKEFGLILGVMNFAVLALLLLIVSSYFLFHELSKNRALALLLAISVGLSSNIYRQMVWAGSIPYFASQAFFPLIGFLLVRFLNTRNYKWLYAAAISAGLGLLGHPQPFLNVIAPFSFLVLWFYGGREGLKSTKRFWDIVIFFGIFLLVGLPIIVQSGTLNLISNIFSIFGHFGDWSRVVGKDLGPEVLEGTALDLVNYHKKQFLLVYSDSQRIIWWTLISIFMFWVATLVFQKKRIRSIFSVLPFALFLVYEVGVIFLFSRGIDVLVNHWNKALWPVPIAAGACAAVLFGQTVSSLDRFLPIKFFRIFKFGAVGVVSIALLLVVYISFPHSLVKDFSSYLDSISSPSSPYPDILNVKISDADRAKLAPKLLPPFIDPNDKNKRLYAIDATVNLSWNTMYDLPLARGYIDPPITTLQRWGLFWLDSVLGPSGKGQESSLILDWNVPKEVVDENIKFLLDWNAIYYLLGNYQSENPNILAKNVTTDDFIEKNTQVQVQGSLARYELTEDYKNKGDTFYWDRYKIMNYYKVKEELVSPIISPTDATPVLLIGDDAAYDTIYRFLGMRNLNSQKIVVATKSNYIDDYSLEELRKFDALILYRYDYHSSSKAWNLIGKYLKAGGKVYIDTGPDVKEAASGNLPDFFPFRKSTRGDIGAEWNVTIGDESFAKGVDFSKFSPLLFDGGIWNVSHPGDDTDLDTGARMILKNNGKIVAASVDIESGKLIWTGFNLPYHTIREYNQDEANFFVNLLSSLFDFSVKQPIIFDYSFISPEKRAITINGARSVIFKEEAYSHWLAKSEKGQTLQVYKAGPTYPGYIYVTFSKDSKPDKVTFYFKSEIKWWIYYLISILTLIFLLDKILTNGFLLVKPSGKILLLILKPTARWWQREEEE